MARALTLWFALPGVEQGVAVVAVLRDQRLQQAVRARVQSVKRVYTSGSPVPRLLEVRRYNLHQPRDAIAINTKMTRMTKLGI